MKRYVMECIGTFFLTLAISLTANPIAIGLMLVVMVYVGGHVSGAHCNPAVSLAVFLEKHISIEVMLGYWFAQCIGAGIALHFFMMITSSMFVPEMVPGTFAVPAMLVELVCTMFFCFVVLTMCFADRYKNGLVSGMVIGLALTSVAFIGGLFNPAVVVASFMCNFVKSGIMCDAVTFGVYVISPLCGAFLGSLLYCYFKPERT